MALGWQVGVPWLRASSPKALIQVDALLLVNPLGSPSVSEVGCHQRNGLYLTQQELAHTNVWKTTQAGTPQGRKHRHTLASTRNSNKLLSPVPFPESCSLPFQHVQEGCSRVVPVVVFLTRKITEAQGGYTNFLQSHHQVVAQPRLDSGPPTPNSQRHVLSGFDDFPNLALLPDHLFES